MKGLNEDRVVPHESDVGQGGGKLTREVELRDLALSRPGGHRCRRVEQQTDRRARLRLEHFEEQLFEPQIGAPVHRAQIVALMKPPVVVELHAGSGKVRRVVPAHEAPERLLPVNGQAFETFEERAVDQRRGHGLMFILL